MPVKYVSNFALCSFVTTQELSVAAVVLASAISGGVRLGGRAAGRVPPPLQTDTRYIACDTKTQLDIHIYTHAHSCMCTHTHTHTDRQTHAHTEQINSIPVYKLCHLIEFWDIRMQGIFVKHA